MTLSRRLGRIEASISPIAPIEIEAGDEAEAESRFLDGLAAMCRSAMNGLLSARLDKLKAAMLDPKDDRPKWVIRIVASDEEEAEAVTLARAEGWDPDGDDISVIRLIATASQRERTTSDDRLPPHVMSKNW